MNILEVKNLSVRFPTKNGTKTVLQDISFVMKRGEVLGLVGESGSGKSMTARAIAKLLPPKAQIPNGEIIFDSTDLLRIKEHEMRKRYRGKRISMIFQDAIGTFNPVVSVGQQLEEMFALHLGITGKEAELAGKELLKQVRISDVDEKYKSIAGILSGGQAQRVSLAMLGLITKPELLIVDEATTALDVTVQAQVLDLFIRMAKENDISLLFITHDFGLVAEYADRIVVLDKGSVVETGSTEEIFYEPKSDYVRGVLRDLPRMDRRLRASKVESSNNETVLNIRDMRVVFPVFGSHLFFLQKEVGSVKAVDGVSFTLNKGEILGIVGESGCGKTTLMRAILDVLPPEAVFDGSVMLGDRELTTLSSGDRKSICQSIGGVAQGSTQSLNPRMRIRDIIAEGLDIHGLYQSAPGKDRDEEKTKRVESLMNDVGLPLERMYDFTGRFSGGELQRVAIARALATEPDILILDEPTSSLDASRKRTIMELLVRLQKERNLSYILITHELPAVAGVCDRIAVMYLGKIVEMGSTEEVFANPLHPYTKALLAAVPIPDPKQARARTRELLEGEVPSATNIPSGCRFRTRCPFATELCAEKVPELTGREVSHTVACHYAEEIKNGTHKANSNN